MVPWPTRRVGSRAGRGPVLVLVLVLVLMMAAAGEGLTTARVPVSTGVFTLEQAESGREAYARSCARCHGADLSGDVGPSLAPLDRFAFRDAPLSRLFEIMRTEMPFDAPGSLDPEVYAAILAYVLHENGYPGGPDPLPVDTEALDGFVLDTPPAD
jgi:mono/diheme cytochrome c family protein